MNTRNEQMNKAASRLREIAHMSAETLAALDAATLQCLMEELLFYKTILLSEDAGENTALCAGWYNGAAVRIEYALRLNEDVEKDAVCAFLTAKTGGELYGHC